MENPKLIKYMTRTIDWEPAAIEAVEVARETSKQVILARINHFGEYVERRESKMSEYTQYHDTWEDAKAYLQSKAEKNAELAKAKLQKAESDLEHIKALRKE